jgi:hypothetical protein
MRAKYTNYRRRAAYEIRNHTKSKNRFWAALRDPLNIFTGVLAISTAGLVVVAAVQSYILEKTDQTFRAGERAFVFVKGQNTWLPAETFNTNILRSYVVEWENSGNTETKNLFVRLYCPRPSAFDTADPITLKYEPSQQISRLLGPKQSTWAGVCIYSDEELSHAADLGIPIYVASNSSYFDTFDDFHLTEYCVKLVQLTSRDFKNKAVVPNNLLEACTDHNCADKECPDYEQAALDANARKRENPHRLSPASSPHN